MQEFQNSQQRENLSLDFLISRFYLPHARLRKRSWRIDEAACRERISPAFGQRRLGEIAAGEVEQWLGDLLSSGLAPVSCNRILAVFKAVCSFFRGQGIISVSPCSEVKPFRVNPPACRYLSPEEGRALLAALEKSRRPEALALRLLLLTGARKSEISRARWEFLRFEPAVLVIPLSKSGKTRHIPLSRKALAAIAEIPRKEDCPWLFPGRSKDKPLSDIYLFWNRLRQDLGLEGVRIHDLRHTFATLLINSRHSLYIVQKILGHADPRTTMRYAHLSDPALWEAAEFVGQTLARKRRGIENSGENISLERKRQA